MTRYEKAWQALVRKEGERLKSSRKVMAENGAREKLNPTVGTECGGYLITTINREVFQKNFGDSNYKEPQPESELIQKEHHPHWFCYALEYHLKLEKTGKPSLDGDVRPMVIHQFSTVFYPWQRGFFTKFEQKLDEILLNRIYAEHYAAELAERQEATQSAGHQMKDQLGKRSFVAWDALPKGKVKDLRDKVKKGLRIGIDGIEALKSDNDDGVPQIQGSNHYDIEVGKTAWSSKPAHKNRWVNSLVPMREMVPESQRYQEINEIDKESSMDSVSNRNLSTLVSPKQDTLMIMVDGRWPGELNDAEDTSINHTEEANRTAKLKSPEVTVSQQYQVWKEVRAPGVTVINGLSLDDAKIVCGNVEGVATENQTNTLQAVSSRPENSDTVHAIQALPEMKPRVRPHEEDLAYKEEEEDVEVQTLADSGAKNTLPRRFVVNAKFKLFGKHETEIFIMQDVERPKLQHYRIKFPGELSLGAFMPSLAGSDFDAIAMRDSLLEYRSSGKRSGLSLSTEITLSGFLQPVHALLRDAFGQERPRINVTTRFAITSPELCLLKAPEPLGFTLRGELPEVNVPDLFGVLTVTHIGVDVTGRRRGSAGGYDLGYGFFGKGRVDATTAVSWRISKFGQYWSIAIRAEFGDWKDVAGVKGVDVRNLLPPHPNFQGFELQSAD